MLNTLNLAYLGVYLYDFFVRFYVSDFNECVKYHVVKIVPYARHSLITSRN